mmetsp:Transcript_12202/g.22183  ORF Transcript_12202/g.22183 Transcript_12202/m.22183 type:complete len:100 (+) Transcript_12202:542-841(+)
MLGSPRKVCNIRDVSPTMHLGTPGVVATAPLCCFPSISHTLQTALCRTQKPQSPMSSHLSFWLLPSSERLRRQLSHRIRAPLLHCIDCRSELAYAQTST